MQLPSETDLARAAAGIAAISCVLAAFEARVRAKPWVVRALAIGLALASVTAYYEFFTVPLSAFFHRWEMFHYVLGSKYSHELGYERLYTCVALADADNGHREEVSNRLTRDLRDDGVISGAVALQQPDACKRHFTAARWSEFRHDVGVFRALVRDERTWSAMQLDHGYNPSPVWTLVGGPLASAAPLSARLLNWLAWIDPLLMAASLGLLAWGFGWRIAWLACVFWSTQAPSSFAWTGGAFLRQDWLLLAVAALVLLRKRHDYAAGACLAWSAALRLFPSLFFAGVLVLAARGLIRDRRLAARPRAVLIGAVAATGSLLALTFAAGSDVARYRSFAEHIHMHSTTQISNHLSLRNLLSFAPEARAAEDASDDESAEQVWAAVRSERLRTRWPLRVAIGGLLVLGWLRCVWQIRTPWIALALSFVLVLVFTDPSSYYFSMLILVAPLAHARRSVEVMLLGVAAASQLLMLQLRWMDARYAAVSALYILFAAALLAVFSRPLRHASR